MYKTLLLLALSAVACTNMPTSTADRQPSDEPPSKEHFTTPAMSCEIAYHYATQTQTIEAVKEAMEDCREAIVGICTDYMQKKQSPNEGVKCELRAEQFAAQAVKRDANQAAIRCDSAVNDLSDTAPYSDYKTAIDTCAAEMDSTCHQPIPRTNKEKEIAAAHLAEAACELRAFYTSYDALRPPTQKSRKKH